MEHRVPDLIRGQRTRTAQYGRAYRKVYEKKRLFGLKSLLEG